MDYLADEYGEIARRLREVEGSASGAVSKWGIWYEGSPALRGWCLVPGAAQMALDDKPEGSWPKDRFRVGVMIGPREPIRD